MYQCANKLKMVRNASYLKFIARFSSTSASLLDNLGQAGKSHKQFVAILADTILAAICLWSAYSLRLGIFFTDFGGNWQYFMIMMGATPVIFAGFGIYKWIIRTSNTRLFVQLLKGAIIASVGLLAVMFLVRTPVVAPRSIFLIFGILLFVSSVGVRLLWKWALNSSSSNTDAEPVAVYGAGQRGRDLLDLLELSNQSQVVLFLDDNPALHKSTVAGVRVIDPASPGLGNELLSNEVNRVILASPKLDKSRIQKLLRLAIGVNIPVQTLPTINEVVAGRAAAGVAREVTVGDLLGRDEVPPDAALLSASVTGKSILVTGGGGSIGSEICRQCLQLDPARLVVLDQSEENLYRIAEQIAVQKLKMGGGNGIEFLPVLGSVNNRRKVSELIESNNIQTIFHAAAYKHVPIIESAIEEGFRTNVLGTKNVLDIAVEHQVEKFVLISTDKAVRPTNVMGATKRIAELVLQAKCPTVGANTSICMVRFGNVLGSSGSVVPKFTSQIRSGGPVTITHNDITRYFMSIPEASQLVLQAASLGEGGEVFVLDMGEPVKIMDLATAMIELTGYSVKSDDNPKGDIAIEITGLRPGEKLFEEMFIGEDEKNTSVKKIFVADESFLPEEVLNERLRVIQDLLETADREAQKGAIMALVAEGSDSVKAGSPKKGRSSKSPKRGNQNVLAESEEAVN